MNPFSSLITQLPSSTARRGQVIEAEYTVTRVYRPTGHALSMIQALRARGGPMTSAELGVAVGVDTKQVPSLLAVPLRTGLVTLDCAETPVKWESR